MELWIGAINLGLLYSFMAIGTYITYKLYSFADITIDGTFTTGAAVASILIVAGWNPWLVVPVAFFTGALAGFITGFIHTRFKIEGLLSGILVMTGLYSVNLHIMGKSNIPLLNHHTFISVFSAFNPGIMPELWTLIFLVIIVIIFWMVIALFLSTDFGLTMQATGNNPVMVAAQGVSVNRMKIFGIALANGFVGISGALIAQYQGFADIGMGIGSIIFSLASVIIGEALFRKRSMFIKILGVILGSIIFRLAVALALNVGMDPNDLKLITAFFVLLTLIASGPLVRDSKGPLKRINDWLQVGSRKLVVILLAAAALVSVVLIRHCGTGTHTSGRVKIGIVMANNSDIVSRTRDGIVEELARIGYVDGENCQILEQNAEGDIPTNQTIIDHFIKQGVDIFVPISTASTQAAIHKVKDRPIVFATVANPFIIGAGTSPTDHPANLTGVYGSSPIGDLLNIFRKMYPGKVRIGTIYNPAYPNTMSNLREMKKALESHSGVELIEATISGSGDVYQAALSMASRKVDAFVLINDITVFNSFESIVRVSRNSRIPVFTCDAERLKDGALIVYGYEYYGSGIQAAHLIDRILKGADPAGMPFEKYRMLLYGVNYDVAKQLGVTIPETVIRESDAWVKEGRLTRLPMDISADTAGQVKKKLALFQINNSLILERTKEGFLDRIRVLTNGTSTGLNIAFYDAHGDYSTGQAIAQAISKKDYDYVVTISTLALQMMANNNTRIPHIFCAVTDPLRAGVGTTLSDHRPNLTGLATPQPVEATIRIMRTLLPRAKTVGMIWNPGEVNSEICTKMAREACRLYRFRLIEKTITSLNELDDARKSLVNAGIDIYFLSGDVMVSQAIPQLAKAMTQAGIPFFSNNADEVNQGTFISIGADYYEVGEKAAETLHEVMRGANPARIPIRVFVPWSVGVNLKLARQYGVSVPDTMITNARFVIR